MSWYALLVLLVLLVLGSILWDWRRSGRLFCTPLPHPFRDRQSQEPAWRQLGSEQMEKVDALLRIVCEAFSFDPDERYRLAPTDRIVDVYRACYPRWKIWNIGDNLELASLMTDLSQQFAVEVEAWRPDIKLGEIVGMMKSSPENVTYPMDEGR